MQHNAQFRTPQFKDAKRPAAEHSGGYRVSEIRARTTLRNRVAWVYSGHLRLVVGGQNQVAAGANMMRLAY
jgi:hypothetical protein